MSGWEEQSFITLPRKNNIHISQNHNHHMTFPWRFLGEGQRESSSSSSVSAPHSPSLDSDFLVILAALLCALICVLGLVAVARCACLRRFSSSAPPPRANKGIKKKTLRSLPKLTITPESAATYPDCAICLTDLIGGDEIRLLPQCGHGFHVSCIDKWLESHSSCPSCRQILVVSRSHKCGSFPGNSSTAAESEARMKHREDDVNRFLP